MSHGRLDRAAPARERRVGHLADVLQDRGLDLFQPAVSRDGVIFNPQQVKRENLVQTVGVLRVERERFELLCLHQVGGDVEAGRRILADVNHQRTLDPGDQNEIGIVRFQRRSGDQLAGHVQRKKADRFAVRCGFSELVAADKAAGAADIFHDNGGVAGNMPRQMQRDDPALKIRRSTGGIVDDHGDRLALVELSLRAARNSSGEHDESKARQNCPYHRPLLK